MLIRVQEFSFPVRFAIAVFLKYVFCAISCLPLKQFQKKSQINTLSVTDYIINAKINSNFKYIPLHILHMKVYAVQKISQLSI